MSMRTRVTLDCPGSLATASSIANAFGLSNLECIGPYPVAIAGVSKDGKVIEPHIFIYSGQIIRRWMPPNGSVKVVAAASNLYIGNTAIEFDTPII